MRSVSRRAFVRGATDAGPTAAFVIGPAISDTDPQPEPDPIEQIEPEHDEHHG